MGFWGEVLENTNLKNNDVFENTMLGEVFEIRFNGWSVWKYIPWKWVTSWSGGIYPKKFTVSRMIREVNKNRNSIGEEKCMWLLKVRYFKWRVISGKCLKSDFVKAPAK